MILEDLSWLIYGILIGLFVPLLLLIGNKQFGISSGLQNICSLILPKTKKIFSDYNFKSNDWKVYFIIGIILGGFLTSNFFTAFQIDFLPEKYNSLEGIFILLLGGFLVGFGSRYAKGCTSGHSIMGLSLLQLSSLIATISFFIGGLFFIWII